MKSVEAEAWETPRSSTGIPSAAAQTQARAQNSSPETYVNGALHPLTCSTSEGSIKPKLNPNRSTGGLSASDMHQEVVERRISGELAGPGTLTGKEDFSTTRRQPGLCLRFLGNLREVSLRNRLPEGKCIYIQSGDPSDFDGYLIARAGEVLSKVTKDFAFAVVVPEERAPERDVMSMDENAEVSMDQCGRMLRCLCPHSHVVRGPVNEKNIFALMNAPDKYTPALATIPKTKENEINWTTIDQLVEIVNDPAVKSVILDLMGSSGYMEPLMSRCPDLALKVRASNFPIPLMGGVLAERKPQTLRVPGRDPRAGMNCIYHKPKEIMELAKRHNCPMLFVSNNCTADILKFDNDVELVKALELEGLLKCIAECWFAPHLQGRYVVFDWVAFCALLLFQRAGLHLDVEDRELWVGEQDCSVMVLKKPSDPITDVIKENLEGTVCYGVHKSVVNMDRDLLLHLARELKTYN
eukprot:CAMPEP_0177769180 /NCGR_PEP_ID=MMETSP0491_2-20121128/10172_1 /TAXON_ID=63592 /ORGANISM="Tetraselmis chuii, Strain PLY429" /LENGTH=467 /DNA_ID=CAMNT_0019286147 /DNA_START=1323 /DNA_END=2726 /DNA_ORIENTATION=-